MRVNLPMFIFFLGIGTLVFILILKLMRQRREYRILFESVPCTISIQNKNFEIIQYNREFAETFDITQGKYCYTVYKSRRERCVVCPVSRTFKDGKVHYSEEERTNRDGSKKFWIVKTAPIRNTKGEITAAIEMCLDVTHRKELEEELARSEKKYYAIFNNIPNPVFVLDPDSHRILDCNRSAEAVYGYEQAEMISRSFLDFFIDEDKSHYEFNLNKTSEINQVKHVGKNGGVRYVNIRISPTEFLGQHVLLVTVSDITKRLEAEQQLTQASKLATLGEMATGVAHELNQPLTVIKMASTFFMKKIKQNEPIPTEILHNMSEKISNNIDRANRIINHMRDFARKSDIRLEKVQVNEVLEKAFEIFSQQLKLRQIEVVWEIQKNLPVIMADAGRLEQVFINLLINARDGIEKRWFQKEVTDPPGKRIFLKTELKGKKVVVEVTDTGTGIPAGIREKIFEPFFTTKEVGKGTGLGLSISYGIVKDFQGEIRLCDTPRSGACFHLEFPIHQLTQETGHGKKQNITGR